MKLSSGEIIKLLLWLCLFALLCAFWWYCFEKRVSAVPQVGKAAKENTFLAASRFLKKHDYRVKTIVNLEGALDHPLPKGTMYLRSMSGTIEPAQIPVLLSWVEQGNTLIYQPRWTGKSMVADLALRCAKTPLQLSQDLRDKTEVEAENEEEKGEEKDEEKEDEAEAEAGGRGGQTQGDEASATDASAEAEEGKDGAKEVAKKDAKNDGKDDGKDDDSAKADDDDSASLSLDPIPRTRVSSGSLDPISKLLGIELRKVSFSEDKPEKDKKADAGNALQKLVRKKATACPAEIQWPGTRYALQMNHDNLRLFSKDDNKLKLTDQSGQALRIYQQGQGHIVVLAEDYFQNAELAYFDHAEALLKIMSLQAERTVLVIQNLKHETWYQKLWSHFYLALSACVLGLLLLLWMSVRRFGSTFPLPEPDRRALLEHIDASSRWLWQVPGGRDILLNAMRSLTVKVLERRAPAIMRLSQTEQIAKLSEICSINRPDLVLALSSGVAPTPLLFIRQIKTLQRLRKHYER